MGIFLAVGLASGVDGHGLEPQGVDILMLIDESGSMKKLDPKRFAGQAAQLLADLSRLFNQEVRLGIVTFGEGAKVLLPITPLDSAAPKLGSLLSSVRRDAPVTDIRSGLEVGYELLNSRKEKRKAFVVIITDGALSEADIPKGENIYDYKRKCLSIAGNYNLMDWPIYTIAFTTQTNLYRELARATGGEYFEAKPEDVPDTYRQIFQYYLMRFYRTVRPASSEGKTVEVIPVDESVSEITLVVAKEKGKTVELVDPSGQPANAEVIDKKAYLIIRVRNPRPGTWKAVFKQKGVALYSIVIPQIIEPAQRSIPIDEPIRVRVRLVPTEPGKPVYPQDYSGEVYIHYPSGRDESFRLFNDGTHGDSIPNDDVLSRDCPAISTEGEYHMTVVIRHKKTRSEIRVKRPLTIEYRPKLVASIENPGVLGEPMVISAYVPNKGARIFTKESYKVTVTSPKFETYTLELRDDGQGADDVPGDGRFTGLFTNTSEPGRYTFKVEGFYQVQVAPGQPTRSYHEVQELGDEVWLSFDDYATPGCLWFGELAGGTYEHKLTFTSHYPGVLSVNLYTYQVQRKGAKALVGGTPVLTAKAPLSLEEGKSGVLKVEARIPSNTPPGTWDVTASGMLQPIAKPVKCHYQFKTSTKGRVFLFGFLSATVIGGSAGLIWYMLNR